MAHRRNQRQRAYVQLARAGRFVSRHRRPAVLLVIAWTAVRLESRRPRPGDTALASHNSDSVGNGIEVERKFLVAELPADLDSFARDEIQQGYVALDGETEVRVRRRRGHSPVLTVKSGGGLSRTEEEIEIGDTRYEALWALTAGRRIEKTRYTVPAGDGLVFDLDVYNGFLRGLVTAEVEFPSVEASAHFEPPSWLGLEVTEDSSYKNQALAQREAQALAERVFRLRLDESVAEGIRRIALGQIDQILDRLEGRTDEDLGTAVHESRKSLKRLRTVVRLVRVELGPELRARENASFRDASRELSGPRDSQVVVQSLDALLERYPEELAQAGLEGFRSRLVRAQEAVSQGLTPGSPTLAQVERALREARERAAGWPLSGNGIGALEPGLRRAYLRGRAAQKTARKDPSPDNLHEWRKRVKDLWYSVQILEAAEPRRMKSLAQDAHKLSELLGDDHDLVVLEQHIDGQADAFPHPAAAALLRVMSEQRRRELEAQAFELGSGVYRESPRAFVRRVDKGWRRGVRALK
ncbi:MAG TPA: CHAD domain-containing protein [Thermoleophilaceae bacterium]|jgi:CYTH domain-containing protein/CHAD domain-containing protein